MASRFTPHEIREIITDVKKEILMIKLSELRRIMNVTQQEIKGFSQPAVASLEKRKNMSATEPKKMVLLKI
jgi:hypothetical protein